MKIPMPYFARKACEVAATLGGRGLLVGGAVRDALMGIESKDFDIEIQGMSEETFRGPFLTTLRTFGRVDEVGVSFGVLKFGHDVDISLPRRDSKTGEGHRAFEVTVDTGLTLQEALSRRDLTINAIAWDPSTGDILDPFGGWGDIEAGVLRHVGPAFAEDPLRVMRVVQFAARFGFTLDPDTAEMCQGLLRELRGMAKERLWGEWEKVLFKGTDFRAFHRALIDTHLCYMAPYATIGTSYMHPNTGKAETLIAERLTDPTERAAALLGYWSLRCEDGTRYGRRDQITEFWDALDVPHALRRTARKFHDGMLFTSAYNGGLWSASDARMFARILAPVSMRSICAAADGLWIKESERVRVACEAARVLDGVLAPVLTGEALIELGWTPGPAFGPVLKAALEHQDMSGETDRDVMMTLAQRGAFGDDK